MPASNTPSIVSHGRQEIQTITRDFDWSRIGTIPRAAMEELMLLAFVRGATYAEERRMRANRGS